MVQRPVHGAGLGATSRPRGPVVAPGGSVALSSWARFGAFLARLPRRCRTVEADPGLNVRKHPDLALGKFGDGPGKVGPHGELVDPLAAHAEHVTDLVRSHQGNGPMLHAHDYRRRTR